MRQVLTIPFTKQAKVALSVLSAYTLALAPPVSAANLQDSSRDRLISIHKTLFTIYKQQQRLDDVLREGESLELLSKEPEFPKMLGKVLFSNYRYSQALTHYNRALELGAAREDLDQDIYTILMELHRYGEAQDVRKRMELALEAKNAKLHPHLTLPPAHGSDVPWQKPISTKASRTSMLDGKGRQMQPIAMLPASAHLISITLGECDFKIVHESRPDLLLIANYPNHWKNISGSQTQIGRGSYPVGHFHTINGEEIWTGAVTLSSDGISLNDILFEKFPAGTVDVAMSTSTDGCMTVNNIKVRVGPLDPEVKSEADIVQLLVPVNYLGDLELRTNLNAKGDFWRGGISLFAGRPSKVQFEKVTAEIKSDIETSGYANLLIKKLEAKEIRLSANKESIIHIDSAKAIEMNLKSTDNGKIDIKSGAVDRLHTNGVTQNILFNNSVMQSGN